MQKELVPDDIDSDVDIADPELPANTDGPQPGETDGLQPGETDGPQPGETGRPQSNETDPITPTDPLIASKEEMSPSDKNGPSTSPMAESPAGKSLSGEADSRTDTTDPQASFGDDTSPIPPCEKDLDGHLQAT